MSFPVNTQLQVTPGTTSGGTAPLVTTYQWKLGGVDIGGATSATYTPGTAGSLTCVQTVTDAGSVAITRESAAATIVAAVSFVSAAVNGTALTVTLSNTVSVVDGTGFNVDASVTGSNIAATYVSGSGTAILTFSLASPIVAGETVDLDYTTVTNGIEDAGGNDLPSITSGAVTNNTPAVGDEYTLVTNVKAEGTTLTTVAQDTTGCTLLVAVANYYDSNASDNMVIDSKANTWVELPGQEVGSASVRMYYCIAPTVGSGHTFTVQNGNGGAAYMNIAVLGFSRTSPLFDAAAAGSVGNINPTRQPGSITPAGTDGLMVAACGADTALHVAALTVDSSFVVAQRAVSTGPVGMVVCYKIKTDSAAENPTFTENADGFPAGGCIMTAFK